MKAIDVHGHYGLCNNHGYNTNDQMMSGGLGKVRIRAEKNNIIFTFVSPLKALMPYGGDVLEGNNESNIIGNTYSDIKFWIVLNPKMESSIDQAYSLMHNKNFTGIKIHPTLHEYKLKEYGDMIFRYAVEYNLIILTHSGCGTPPEDIALFANKYKEAKIIMAHLGSSDTGDLTRQVDSFKKAKSDNLYIDTSSGCSIYSGLIEWAVGEIGSSHILFGSDTPLHDVSCQKARIENAFISEEAIENILFNNAKQLFNLNI